MIQIKKFQRVSYQQSMEVKECIKSCQYSSKVAKCNESTSNTLEIFKISFEGKIRHLIPYQPQYKYQESIEDGEANISQCHHCDTQIRQVIR